MILQATYLNSCATLEGRLWFIYFITAFGIPEDCCKNKARSNLVVIIGVVIELEVVVLVT